MKQTPWTEQHSGLLAEARPDVPAATDHELALIWDQVEHPVATTRRTTGRSARLMIGAGVAVGALGITGAAAAGVFSARTGGYPSGWEVKAGGPGEILDPAAPDWSQVLGEELAGITYPSAETEQISYDFQRRDMVGGKVSTGALRGFAANDAICAWANEWAAGKATRDQEAVVRATQALDAAATWPAVTALDPEQKMRTRTASTLDGEQSQWTTAPASATSPSSGPQPTATPSTRWAPRWPGMFSASPS